MPPGHVFDFRMLYTLPHVEAIESSIPDAAAPDRRTRADRESDACTDALAGVALGGGIGRDVRDHSRCTLARRSVACVQSCVEMRESCLPYVHAMCLPCPSHVSAAPSCAFRNDHALESS